MKIVVGSQNEVKVNAVKELLCEYPHLCDAEVTAVDVPSGVDEQPKSLEETVRGAMGRAKAARGEAEYGLGIESGLMEVPYTKSGYMDVCVCAIYDGSDYHLGLSSAWEAPREVARYMIEDGLNMTDASVKAGLTDNPLLGAAEGLIGIMTKGRLDRKGYTKEAIRTALIHLER